MKRALIAALVATLFVVSLGTAQDADTTKAQGSMTEESSMSSDMGGNATVAEMAFCTSVEDRQPAGEATNFGADVGSVTCFTKITGVDGESSITHVWYHGDAEMGRVELPVRSSMWRTWSTKTISPEATGDWRVDVLSANGDVLKSATFTVGSSGGM